MSFFFSRQTQLEESVRHAVASFEGSGILVITGASGVGKSFLAAKIHRAVAADSPFVVQDAAGLAEARFESQLFGHVKGAFSGASRRFGGLLGAVGKGTFCIEGLEDLSLGNQARMLRFLQEGSYRGVGSTTEQLFGGRLMFTGRRGLDRLRDEGLLREDFYFRIAGFELCLPPLTGRPLDFEDIFNALVTDIRKDVSVPLRIPSRKEMEALKEFPHEGHCHGLRNLLQRAMIEGVPPVPLPVPDKEEFGDLPDTGSLKSDLRLVERRLLARGLRLFPHSRETLAGYLGISRRSLLYKLKEHGFTGFSLTQGS